MSHPQPAVSPRSRALAMIAVAALTMAAVGCTDPDPDPLVASAGPTATMVEIPPAGRDVPTADVAPTADTGDPPTQPSSSAAPAVEGEPTPTPSVPSRNQVTQGSTPIPLPTAMAGMTVAEIAGELGLDGLIELLQSDPDLAGDRGESLLRELVRFQEKPEEKRRDRVLERVDQWLASGRIDAEVAEAARVVVSQAIPE